MIPEYIPDIVLPRFIWPFTIDWYHKTTTGLVDDGFWASQADNLRRFDQKNPGHFRPAGMEPAKRLKIPRPQFPVMVTSGSNLHKQTPGNRPTPPPPASTPSLHHSPMPSSKPVSARQFLPRDTIPEPPALVGNSQVLKPGSNNQALMDVDIPPRKNKGKEKALEHDLTGDEYVDELSDDESKSSEREGYKEPAFDSGLVSKRPAGPIAGPSKRQPSRHVKEDVQERPPATQREKKRASPKPNGSIRDPPCTRCAKSGRTCQEQAGTAKACIFCARIKMKCFGEDDEPEKKKVKVRVIDPVLVIASAPELAQGPVTVSAPAPVPTPVPAKAEKKKSAPVIQPVLSKKRPLRSKKTPAKKKPAKIPPPAPSQTETKKPSKRPTLNSKPAQDYKAPVNVGRRGEVRQPMKRKLDDLDPSDSRQKV